MIGYNNHLYLKLNMLINLGTCGNPKKMNKQFTVIRTIHSVGQGAFYTEEFFDNDHNRTNTVVFDCGSETKIGQSNCIKKMVNGAFREKQCIDIFFISHFDKDHVNGIEELTKKNRLIKNVVIPQLDGYQWFYVVENVCAYGESIKSTTGTVYNLKDLLTGGTSNGRDYEKARIIQVEPIDSDSSDNAGNFYRRDNAQPSVPSIREVGNSKGMISSGTAFGIVSNPRWIFQPVNFTYKRDIKTLKKELQDILDKDDEFSHKSLSSLSSSELCKFIERYRTHINKVYNKVFPSTNASSLCVYSGMLPSEQNSYSRTFSFITSTLFPDCSNRTYLNKCDGCLYTGDSVMDGVKHLEKTKYVLTSIENWIDHLGILQIPHHGSKYNFGKQAIGLIKQKCHMNQKLPILCFASFGSHNRYGHPSDALISELLASDFVFTGITEDKATTLRQRIDVMA